MSHPIGLKSLTTLTVGNKGLIKMTEKQEKLKIWKKSIRKFNSDWGILVTDIPIKRKEKKD